MAHMKILRLAACSLLLAACAADDETAPPALALIGFEVSFRDALTGDPLADVEICADGYPEVACATSDAAGDVALDLPADSEVMLRCQSPTHGPAYMTWALGGGDIDAGSFGLLASGVQEGLFAIAGGTDYEHRGAITVNVYTDLVERDAWVAGATMTMTPATSVGPVYVSEERSPDPDLEASTSGGPGVFVDVEPGEASVTIAHPTLACEPGFGWPSPEPLTLRTRVFAGALSNVTFVCPP
jgi:hypothetical protein